MIVKEKGHSPRKFVYSITTQSDPLSPAITEVCTRSRYNLIFREWDTHIRSYRTYPVVSCGVARLEYVDECGCRFVLDCSEKRIVSLYENTPYEEYITCHLHQYPFYKFEHHYFCGGHWHLIEELAFDKLGFGSFYADCCRTYGYYGNGEQEL